MTEVDRLLDSSPFYLFRYSLHFTLSFFPELTVVSLFSGGPFTSDMTCSCCFTTTIIVIIVINLQRYYWSISGQKRLFIKEGRALQLLDCSEGHRISEFVSYPGCNGEDFPCKGHLSHSVRSQQRDH